MVKMPHATIEGLYNKDKHILTMQLIFTDENGRKKVLRGVKAEKNTEKVRNAFMKIETKLMQEIFSQPQPPTLDFYKNYIKNLLNIDLKEVNEEINLKPRNFNYIYIYKDYLPYVTAVRIEKIAKAPATKEAVAKEEEAKAKAVATL